LTSFSSGSMTASVHELIPIEPVGMPERLSDTGYFRSLDPLQPTDQFVAYSVNSPLWSDGMLKTRWFSVPEDATIDNSGDEFEHWKFPDGSVFIKHFRVPADATDSGSPEALETRILIRGPDQAFYGATYVWNDDRSDADLLTERATKHLEQVPNTAETSTGDLDYRFPSPNDCLVCHNRDNRSLGLTAAQLNRSEPDASGENQLLRFSKRGLLEKPYDTVQIQDSVKLCDLHDTDCDLQMRARSYLHSNCSFCHHDHGTQRTHFSASMRVPLEDAQMLNEKAATFYMKIDGQTTDHVIHPGVPQQSLLYRRFVTHEREYAMPYLGRSTVHRAARAVLSDWIRFLP